MTNEKHLVALAKKHPPLTDKQEKELAVLSMAGDLEARDKLVNHNILYAMKVAAKWWREPRYKEYRDEIDGAAMLGLYLAAGKYDGSIRFAAWSWYEVMKSIGECCLDFSSSVTMPVRTLRFFPRVRKAYNALKTHDKEPTVEDLVEKIGAGPESVYWIKPCLYMIRDNIKSLDAGIGDSGTITLHDKVCGDTEQPDEMAEAGSNSDLLNKGLDLLSDKEAYMLRQRYGIGTENGEERSTKDIGAEFGISHQAVSRTLKLAIEKLNGSCQSLNYVRSRFKFFSEAGRDL